MARRKKKAGLYIGIIAVVILLSVSIFFIVQQSTFTGSSLLSLEKVDLKSSFSPLNGAQVWVYSFRLAGLSQYADFISLDVDVDEVGEKYAGGEVPLDSFRLDVSLDEQSCVYDILSNSDVLPIYKVHHEEWNEWGACDWNNIYSECGGSTPINWWTEDFDISGKCNVLCADTFSVPGYFDSPDVNSKFTIGVGKDGSVVSEKSFQTLFSDSESFDVEGSVGSNVYVMWQGNVGSGESCPDKDPYRPSYDSNLKRWVVISNDNYERYLNKFDSFSPIASCLFCESEGTSDAIADSWVREINDYADDAVSSRSFGTLENYASFTDSRAVVGLSSPIEYPLLTAYIKASWIGITTPIGKPNIVDIEHDCFSSSADGKVKVYVKNVGDEREEFEITGLCDAGFTIASDSIYLEPEETDYRTLSISGFTSDEQLNGDCTIYVKGKKYSDSEEFEACVKGIVVCDAGDKTCDGNKIVECNDAGTGLDVVETCDVDCVFNKDGVPYCSEDDDDDDDDGGVCYLGGITIFGKNFGGTQVPTWFCKYGIGLPEVFGFVIGLIVWLGVVVAFSLVESKKKISPAVIWILGFFAGALVFLAFWLLFWVGIIVTIVVIIISNLIKRFVGKKKG